MIDFRQRAEELLTEWNTCRTARPKGNAIGILSEKDVLDRWAEQLRWNMLWAEHENEVAEACHQFESRLKHYKERVIIEILTNGTV